MNEQTKKFIIEHKNEDISALLLKSDSFQGVDISLAVRQIEGMQKVKNKVPSFYENTNIRYPVKLSMEQSSSEITAEYKSTLCQGSKLVDLTGGFGVDCLWLAEKFHEVTYVERQKELCEIARHNFSVVGKSAIQIVHQTAEEFLETNFTADWIYLDPARRKEGGGKAVLLAHCEPNVRELEQKLFEKSPNVMIKLSPMFDLTQLKRELNGVKEIHVIAVENECKEILVLLEKNYTGIARVKAVHFQKNKEKQTLEFTEDEEKSIAPRLADKIEKYLYEPNAAILKVGAFKTVGERCGLNKLHINSHLYTSNELISSFEGRVFEVEKVVNFSKSDLKTLNTPKANLSVRNFPLSVDELRKKLKIKEGGNDFIFASTLVNEKKALIVCRKIDAE